MYTDAQVKQFGLHQLEMPRYCMKLAIEQIMLARTCAIAVADFDLAANLREIVGLLDPLVLGKDA